MDQVKRKLSSDQSSKKKPKKSRNEFDRSITCIENLSNEFFYEIFDYLDGCEIYGTFSNLNQRFEQLLNCSYLLFKINLDTSTSEENLINNFKQIILHKKHQIYSIHLWTSENFNPIFSSFTIDSLFNRLQSLILDDIDSDVLNSLLLNLICLPRLFSLDINTSDSLEELSDVYRLVFALPKLRRLIFSTETFEDFEATVSLPISTYQQFSTIKHLYISHSCTFKELFSIISYTPQLCHLNFTHKYESDPSIGIVLPITLSNLKYISIDGYRERFDTIKILITKIYCKLKVLCLSIFSEDITYLDANQWEQLLLQYLPQLKTFSLEYHVHFVDDDETQIYHGKPNEIISSFWIERQWVFEVAIYSENISYVIKPYRKRWYDYSQIKIVNSSIQLSKSMGITLMPFPSETYVHLLRMINSRILTIAQIYHLEIHNEISIGKLIEILSSLIELDSLYVNSLSLSKPRCLSNQKREALSIIINRNQITKVNLKKMINIEDVYFLIELCPRMNYLQVNCINNMDMELFVRLILIKSNDHLRLLCFRVAAADDKMIKKLEKMVHNQKLLFDYTIKRILDHIYLQWK